MRIYIINFGYKNFRYLPMMELFIADAISRKTDYAVKILTVMQNDDHDNVIESLRQRGDDFITILWETLSSKSTSYIKQSMKFAKTYKERCNAPLIAGGYWASTVGRHFEEFSVFDGIIEGYALERIAEAIRDWDSSSGSKIIRAVDSVDWSAYDLNMEYLQDKSKYYDAGTQFVSGYLSSLGCPNECAFCYNTVLKENEACYAERSLEKVKADLTTLDREYDFKTIQFKDLNYFYNTKRAFKILDYLKQNGKKIQYALDITVNDACEDIFKHISGYGVQELWIGLESFFDDSLKRLNKDYDINDIEKIFAWADKYDITVYGNIMLGAPWQDNEYIWKTIEKALFYINKYNHVRVTFNSLRPIIGTPIQKKYYPNIYDKLTFDEMIDAFTFYLGDKQQKIYGNEFDFVDFEKIHNAFWFINRLRNIECRMNVLFKPIIRGMRKIVESQLRPPYFESIFLKRLFLVQHSTRQRIMAIIWRVCTPGRLRIKFR